MNKSDVKSKGLNWKDLYKIGGLAAIIAALLLPIEIIIFTIWPQNNSVMGYFMLFQSNSLIGLLDFYLLEVVAYALFIPMFLAIYVVIRRFNESYMLIAVVLSIIGITVFFATNNPFSMLSLSNQYVAATTEAQKSMILAAGQAILVNTGQRAFGGFNMGFLFLSIGGLLVSLVMLRGNIFSKATSYIGILAFAISLVDYLRILFMPSIISITLIIALASALFLIIWLLLVGRRLLQLSKVRMG